MLNGDIKVLDMFENDQQTRINNFELLENSFKTNFTDSISVAYFKKL